MAYNRIKTLDTIKVSYVDKLVPLWKSDKRYPVSVIDKFIRLNKEAFDFMGISALYVEDNGKPCLQMTTSQYVGAIPLRHPSTGLPYDDLVVTGRYEEDISEMLSILETTIIPQTESALPLVKPSCVRPPLFFICQNYLDKYIEARRTKWTRFSSEMRIENLPRSSTNWERYAMRSVDPARSLQYPNKRNILTTDHKEWNQLNFALTIAIDEIESSSTPLRSRALYSDKIRLLKSYLQLHRTEAVSLFTEHVSDPATIKELKKLGNLILSHHTTGSFAWRLNFSEFFERFIQLILGEVMKKKGGAIICNQHFQSFGNRPMWFPLYIEPDVILKLGNVEVVADAKYKAHMMQVNGQSNILKEDFRHDLFQVLGYSSFTTQHKKMVMLCFPASKLCNRQLSIKNPINSSESKIILVGLPMTIKSVEESVEYIYELVNFNKLVDVY